MADGYMGRDIVFNWDGEVIPGVREKGIALNGEGINVSSDENMGWRVLLDESGENMVDLNISGVTKSSVLRAAWFAGGAARTKEVTITYPDGGDVITGNFFLVTYSDTGPYNDATTFEATLQSTTAVEYTPGA